MCNFLHILLGLARSLLMLCWVLTRRSFKQHGIGILRHTGCTFALCLQTAVAFGWSGRCCHIGQQAYRGGVRRMQAAWRPESFPSPPGTPLSQEVACTLRRAPLVVPSQVVLTLEHPRSKGGSCKLAPWKHGRHSTLIALTLRHYAQLLRLLVSKGTLPVVLLTRGAAVSVWRRCRKTKVMMVGSLPYLPGPVSQQPPASPLPPLETMGIARERQTIQQARRQPGKATSSAPLTWPGQLVRKEANLPSHDNRWVLCHCRCACLDVLALGAHKAKVNENQMR